MPKGERLFDVPGGRRRRTPQLLRGAEATVRAARAGGLLEAIDEDLIRAVRASAEDYDEAVADAEESRFVRARLMQVHLRALALLLTRAPDRDDDDLPAELAAAVRAQVRDTPPT